MGARDLHRRFRPFVAFRKWHIDLLFSTAVMLEPVMNLKLDPGGRQEVDDCCGFELAGLSRKESVADESWIGVEELVMIRRLGMRSRDISAKSHTLAAHSRFF